MTEWLGTTKGEPLHRTKNDGHIHASCLICRGVKPTAQSLIDFIPQAIGHRVDCKYYETPSAPISPRPLRWG